MTENIAKKTIEKIFEERSEFVVVGLTGRVGSGCSTVCDILSKTIEEFGISPPSPGAAGLSSNQDRDNRIILRYAREHWERFDVIKVRTIITSFILQEWGYFISDLKNYGIKYDKEAFEKQCADELRNKLSAIQARIQKKYIKPRPDEHTNRDALVEKSIDDIRRHIQHFDMDTIVDENTRLLLYKSEIEIEDSMAKRGIVDDDAFELYVFSTTILPAVGDCIHTLIKDKYTEIFQKYGNYIRYFGKIRADFKANGNHIFDIPKRIYKFIKVLRHPYSPYSKKSPDGYPVRVVIDSLKNVYEGNYLRERYSSFYLLSVSKEDDLRKKGLRKKKGLSDKDIDFIDFNERPSESRKKFHDFIEYVKATPNTNMSPDDIAANIALLKQNQLQKDDSRYSEFCLAVKDDASYKDNGQSAGLTPGLFHYYQSILDDKVRVFSYQTGLYQFFLQDIEACIQSADIYLTDNEEDGGKAGLKRAILKYIMLMMHPGLVVPTPVERCMQIAYTAKVNSGCLSRQVGAVVTDSSYNILSLGWNDVPCGEVSCNRKNLIDIFRYQDLPAYSDYEKDKYSSFRTHLERFDFSQEKIDNILNGLPACYCFKDHYKEILGGPATQSYTRALHGEEKALMICDQKAVQGGYLFTTSSPCELCAKNAKQHMIKTIYYIEPYPGISQSHICNSGDQENRARYVLFEGAIGGAYTQLFTPLMPYKDELNLRGFNKFRETGPDPDEGSGNAAEQSGGSSFFH